MNHDLSAVVRLDPAISAIQILATECLTTQSQRVVLPLIRRVRTLGSDASLTIDLTGAQHIETAGYDLLSRALASQPSRPLENADALTPKMKSVCVSDLMRCGRSRRKATMTDSYNSPQHPVPGHPGAVPPPGGAPITPARTPADPDPAPVDGVPPAVPVPGSVPPGSSPTHRAHDDSLDSSDSKADQAKGAAQDVAGDAQDAAQAVKDTAAREAGSVKDDTLREAGHLRDEAVSTVQSQASDQMHRAAGTVRTFSDDLGAMRRGERPEPGLATDLADQVNSRADNAATWLENHEPGDVLHEVQRFAAQRPVAFLAIAAGVGFVAGRLTRGMVQNHTGDEDEAQAQSGQPRGSSRTVGAPAAAEPAPASETAEPAPAPAAAVPGVQRTGAPADDAAPGGTIPGTTGYPYPEGGLR